MARKAKQEVTVAKSVAMQSPTKKSAAEESGPTRRSQRIARQRPEIEETKKIKQVKQVMQEKTTNRRRGRGKALPADEDKTQTTAQTAATEQKAKSDEKKDVKEAKEVKFERRKRGANTETPAETITTQTRNPRQKTIKESAPKEAPPTRRSHRIAHQKPEIEEVKEVKEVKVPKEAKEVKTAIRRRGPGGAKALPTVEDKTQTTTQTTTPPEQKVSSDEPKEEKEVKSRRRKRGANTEAPADTNGAQTVTQITSSEQKVSNDEAKEEIEVKSKRRKRGANKETPTDTNETPIATQIAPSEQEVSNDEAKEEKEVKSKRRKRGANVEIPTVTNETQTVIQDASSEQKDNNNEMDVKEVKTTNRKRGAAKALPADEDKTQTTTQTTATEQKVSNDEISEQNEEPLSVQNDTKEVKTEKRKREANAEMPTLIANETQTVIQASSSEQKVNNDDNDEIIIIEEPNEEPISMQNDAKEAKEVKLISAKRPRKVLFEVPEMPQIAGRVYTLGEEIAGELGPRETLNGQIKSNEPAIVTGINDRVVQTVCGALHTVCLTVNGEVYTFGCNDDFALGRQTDCNLDKTDDTIEDDEEVESRTPRRVLNLPKIVKVTAGDMHTVALADSGSAYIWGNFKDESSKFGVVTNCKKKVDSEGAIMSDYEEMKTPYLIANLPKIVDIASGCHHVLLLSEDGEVFSFGEGSKGQLGRIESTKLETISTDRELFLNPQKVSFGESTLIERIWSAHWSSYAKSITGNVFVWGLNNYHQLGILPSDDSYKLCQLFPKKASELPKDVKMIANGQQHLIVLDNTGKVYSCGNYHFGRLGLGQTNEEVSTPTLIESSNFDNEAVSFVACGDFCTFAITDSGCLYAWGQGSQQIGTKEEADKFIPATINGFHKNVRFLTLSAGSQHTAVLGSDENNTNGN